MGDLISRKMAIDALIACKGKDPFNRYEKQNIGLDWGIEALRQLPSAQPEKRTDKCTEMHACDSISRQAAIDAHYEYCNKHPDAGFPVWSLKILEDLPPSQPDLSGYSDKLWKAAYERGRTEAQAEIALCKDCKNRGDDDCPMRFIEWVEYDDDGYIEYDDIIHDYTKDDGFCDRAERRTNE